MKKRVNRGIALLVGLLVLVAAIPLPTHAATRACPDSIEPAAFIDVGGLSAAALEAIDCIVHYGISQGTTATTFSPNADVPRWQMAVFLVRTVQALGIGLPDGSGFRFSDISGLNPDTQRSIRQLAQLGITSGTGADLFGPLEPVPRWQMAIFLSRLLARAGIALPGGSTTTLFTDLGGLSPEAMTAVSQLVALGIISGTGANTFSPLGPIPRWQIALLLARTLNSGGARHVRLSISLSASTVPVVGSTIVTVLATKPDSSPYPGLLVDLFVGPGLAADGTCLLDADASVNGGDAGTSIDCRIDPADPRTNSRGEVRLGLAHSPVAEVDTILAWVGNEGEVFDADTVTDRVSATVAWTATADGLVMVPGLDVGFGSSVVVIAQLTGAQSAVAGQTVIFEVRRAGIVLSTQSSITTSGGLAQLAYSGPGEPSPGDDDPVIDEVRAFWDRNGNGIDDGDAEFDGTTIVTWDEPVSP